MGKVCSKGSTPVGNTAASRRESVTTPASTTQNGTSRNVQEPEKAVFSDMAAMSGAIKTDGVDAVHVVKSEQQLRPLELAVGASAAKIIDTNALAASQPYAGASQQPEEGREQITVTTVEGEPNVAPVAVIRQEKVVMEEGEKGEGVMKVSVSEAIISANIPGLPATVESVNQEDLELLRKAHEHVKEHRQQGIPPPGPVVVDITDEQASVAGAVPLRPEQGATQVDEPISTVPQDATPTSGHGYLMYSFDRNGGSLSLVWSKELLSPQAEGDQTGEIILLSFVPAAHKTVPKLKFTTKGGRTTLLSDIETKWEVWRKADKQKYYAAWTQAFKTCDEYEAIMTLRQWSTQWPPHVCVALLRAGPTGTSSVIMPSDRPASLGTFNYVAVLPAQAAKTFKAGSSSTERKFVQFAAEAGGASLSLTRRGSAAALDQDVLVEWLKKDGIDVPPDQKGLTLGGEHEKYERRTVDRHRV